MCKSFCDHEAMNARINNPHARDGRRMGESGAIFLVT